MFQDKWLKLLLFFSLEELQVYYSSPNLIYFIVEVGNNMA